MKYTRTLPDIPHMDFLIRVRDSYGNWTYTIYKVTNGKWKRIRGMMGYHSLEEATTKAKNYLNEFSSRHL